MSDVPLMRRIGSVFMARNVVVTGDVVLGDDCSVWPFAVIRGDVAPHPSWSAGQCPGWGGSAL